MAKLSLLDIYSQLYIMLILATKSIFLVHLENVPKVVTIVHIVIIYMLYLNMKIQPIKILCHNSKKITELALVITKIDTKLTSDCLILPNY